MNDLIRRLAAWARVLLAPQGRHRAAPVLPPPAAVRTAAPRHPLPALRSPYGLGLDAPLDADEQVLVRPYLEADEQRQRRRALVLATLGVDLPGPVWVHGVPLGVAS